MTAAPGEGGAGGAGLRDAPRAGGGVLQEAIDALSSAPRCFFPRLALCEVLLGLIPRAPQGA